MDTNDDCAAYHITCVCVCVSPVPDNFQMRLFERAAIAKPTAVWKSVIKAKGGYYKVSTIQNKLWFV